MIKHKRSDSAAGEKRQYPRIALVVPVLLSRSGGPSVSALMQDIAPGGMRVQLKVKDSAVVSPPAGPADTPDAADIQARFLVPVRSRRTAIEVMCDVAHASATGAAGTQAEIAMGLRFRRFSDTRSLRHFMMFIEEQLVPLEDYDVYLHGPGGSPGASRSGR